MVISEVVVVVASPKNSSNLSLLTANTVPLSAHFPINVNAGIFFSFLGNKGDEGIDGKGEWVNLRNAYPKNLGLG